MSVLSPLLAALVLACSGGGERQPGRLPPRADTSAARATSGTTPTAAGVRPACPETGSWSACTVFQRLDRAGLAPQRDSAAAPREPGLSLAGTRFRVGTSELDLYIYRDAKAREADQAKLDRANYADYAAPLPMQPLATLISSANLIAILHSRNEHLRERVADALTAGPPQPQRK